MHPPKKQSNALFAVIVIVLVIGAFFLGAQFGGGNSAGAQNSTPPEGIDLTPLWKVWNVLDEKYVSATSTSEITTQDRIWGMVQGLTDSLGDPYTVFLPPEDTEIFEDDISGNFEGVGMEIGIRNDVLTVVAPLKGTPAYNAGVKAGDKIILIDETETRGLSIDKAVKIIRGPRGTDVKFTIVRDGEDDLITIIVTRDVIEIPTISVDADEGAGLLDNGVYVIELYNFSALSQNLFRQALRNFIISGSDKLVLDLRGNPGGFLEASVDMASWFLPSGKVVVTEHFGEDKSPRIHRSRGYDIFNDNLKMAILIDGGSASASEILAGALREHGVATLIGKNSFGKGSVQELVSITENTSLKVTIARWLTPNGKSISDGGLTPDIEVDIDTKDIENGEDPQLDKATEYLNRL